jgi:hypothetical protein
MVIGYWQLFPFREKTFPLVGRTCAFDAKILGFSGVRFLLSRCGVRDKKNFEKMDFCS